MRKLSPLVALLSVGCLQPVALPRDVRVAVPTPDEAFIDFVTAEDVISPGEEKMVCTEFLYDQADAAFTAVTSLQGKFGHQAILVGTTHPRGAGTSYDCTEMLDFVPIAIPVGDYAAGQGTLLKTGTNVVVQMHYVNTSSQPILVRDVVRLKRVPIASVTTWVAPFALNLEQFVVPTARLIDRSFDCQTPEPYQLLLIGGHMHEHGATYRVEWGPDAAHLQSLYDVTPWKAEYRDSPPVSLFSQPIDVPAGSVFRTTCAWVNETGSNLEYPREMCATFGLVAGTRTPFLCRSLQ